jgi:hypothetical protein
MKMIPMKKHFNFPFCLGILLALLASVTIVSAQRNRNGGGFGNNGGGFGNNGGGFGNNGGGFGNNGGFRNNRLGNSSNVPGPTNYSAFSGFIAVRNIFNPNRFALFSGPAQIITTRVRQSGPEFSLVGTMRYEKGTFAFFDGNNYSYRKVLYQSDTNSIAGYTVAQITATGVQLQTADKKRTLQMKIGDVMRQNNGVWQLSQGELSTFMDTEAADNAPAATGSASTTESSSTPGAAIEGNDILKRLMEQRQKQLGNGN